MENQDSGTSEKISPDDRPEFDSTMDKQAKRRQLEQQAYYGVLRAFKAQSPTLSPEKVKMLLDLTKELRIPIPEHKRYLDVINKDAFIREISNLKLEKECKPGKSETKSEPLVIDLREKQNTSQLTGDSKQSSAGLSPLHKFAHKSPESLVGRKVHIRLPGDGEFSEFLITKYSSAEGLHSLESENDTMEDPCSWVDLTEIPPEDILWEGEESETSCRACSLAPGQTVLRPTSTTGKKGWTADSLFKVPRLPPKVPQKTEGKNSRATPQDFRELETAKEIPNDQEQAQSDNTIETQAPKFANELVNQELNLPAPKVPEMKVEKPKDDKTDQVTSGQESGAKITQDDDVPDD